MIILNLLSPIKKQELRLAQLYITIKNLIILILLFTIIIAVILLLSKMVVQNNFNRIVDQTTLTTKYGQIFNRDIKIFNSHLSAVEKIQKEYISWTDFLISFNQLIPDNVSLYTLNINKNNKDGIKIYITGIAKTRDDLLKLKDNLEKNEMFSEVAIPLENLLKKNDISFNIKSNIN